MRFYCELKPRERATAIASLHLLSSNPAPLRRAHVLREAAVCGVPVVAPRAGRALDVVEHLGTGFLYYLSDAALGDAVAAVVADPADACWL